ncbi:hypothetical protein ACIBTZ_29790 [Micromonospora sp. NPDC049460]|uniref:hypothetical protein n=1 Tax=unclassified Micromonospora TaxID=2617518 RepID=UPI00371A54A0
MKETLPLGRARWCDIGEVVHLVAAALATSAIGAWLVPDECRRHDVLRAVTRIWTEHALLFGEAYLLDDHSAAAVWFHRYGRIPPPTGYGERLAVACGDHLDRFLCLDGVLAAHRPTGPHNHLAFFAATPDRRGVNRAGALLTTSHARMDHALLPAYTEATTLTERDLYTRHGYVAHEPFTLPDGSTAYPMWRSPGAGGTPAQLTRRESVGG